MISDLRKIISDPFMCSILGVSLLLRGFFLFIFLPNNATPFAPDEGTYAELAKYVAEGNPVQFFPRYGPVLYNSSRTLILPSSIFIRLGINEIEAVRLTSTIYGFLSLFMIVLIFLAFKQLSKFQVHHESILLGHVQRAAILLFAFLPSNFLWSTLGLRESASQFTLLSFIYFSMKILTYENRFRHACTLIAAFCLMLSFGARSQTALIFTLVTFLFSIAVAWRIRSLLISFALILGFSLGQFFTATPEIEVSPRFTVIEGSARDLNSHSPSSTKQDVTMDSPNRGKAIMLTSLCKEENQILYYANLAYRCVIERKIEVSKRPIFDSASKQIATINSLEQRRNVNRIDAKSALPQSACTFNLPNYVKSLVCNIQELPYRLLTFLLRPFIIIDSGSIFFLFAGLENLIWLTLILLGLYGLLRGSMAGFNKQILIWLYSYLTVFASAAALYEGNLGTAFRHKSSILWVLCTGLLVTFDNTNINLRKQNVFSKRT